MTKDLLFSLTKDDFRWDYYRGSGKGGQKRNKTSNAVRCTHEPSGAIGKSEEGRSQWQNKKIAFRRMAETDEFRKWVRIEAARKSGDLQKIKERVDKECRDNVRVEVQRDGKWTEEDL